MRKKNATTGRATVPVASKMRKLYVLCGNARATVAKKKALRPNAASGKAVAVPLDSGKLRAAALMEAVNAEQLPAPVKKEKRQSKGRL